MPDLLKRLKRERDRRGSKPRCHLLTHGQPETVAARLTSLASPFATVSPDDAWMPMGFEDLEEAQLHKAARLIDPAIAAKLKNWWLAPASVRAMTPNLDIASTCRIDGRKGLLLIEAKAHDQELEGETAGRRLGDKASDDRRRSHAKIGRAIGSACRGLELATSLPWGISRDSHYQMSNRFAWAWKLTELGIPVVLIYLGFLKATEMSDRGRPFADDADWEQHVRRHSAKLFPGDVWGRSWTCHGQKFIPLIRARDVPLGGMAQD